MAGIANYLAEEFVRAGFYVEHYGAGSQTGWFLAGFGFCGGQDWGGTYLEWCGDS